MALVYSHWGGGWRLGSEKRLNTPKGLLSDSLGGERL